MTALNMSEHDEAIAGIKIEDVLSVDSSGDEEPITMLNPMNESRTFMIKKNWGKGETGEFIANLQQHGALWDTSNPAYNRSTRERSYDDMAKTFNCSVLDIKKKIKTIRTQLIREWRRINRPEELNRADALRNSDWEHWPALQFMLQTITPTRLKSSVPSNMQTYEPQYQQSTSSHASSEYSHEPVYNSSYRTSSTIVTQPQVPAQVAPQVAPQASPHPITTQLHNQHISLKRKLSRVHNDGLGGNNRQTDNVVAVKTCNALTSCMGMLERSVTTKTSGDQVSHFCRHLDDKMKRMDYYTRVLVEKKINDIVFDAEMTQLSQQREDRGTEQSNESACTGSSNQASNGYE